MPCLYKRELGSDVPGKMEGCRKFTLGRDINSPEHVVAVLCHYPGQSQPVSGLERGAMEISERALREVFLPLWVAGIKRAGALGVMATYPAVDGVPTHGSEWILTRILREELGFEGLVLSEGNGIETLIYEGLARNYQEAGVLALRAGVDVGISYESGYVQDMAKSIEQGLVPEALLDRAVRRILTLKFRLGLFESPLVDVARAERIVHNADHQQLALQAARESIVLLRNEGNLLPLRKDADSIAVIGPNADQAKNRLGDYVSLEVPQDVITVLEGIRVAVSPTTKVEYVKGCDVVGTGNNEIAKAQDAARRAKVAVVVLGENEWRSSNKTGTDGEGYDAATLELTGLQLDLVKAVHETGTPTVVVLINGRPLAIRWVAENVPAVVEAWLPGKKGGQAVAEVLFGDGNPGGRLTVTVPRGFEKVSLQPGEKKTVSFALTPEHLALLERHLEWVVEPGTFEVMIGHSARDIRLRGTFEVAGRTATNR